jgi:hypothetical protein
VLIHQPTFGSTDKNVTSKNKRLNSVRPHRLPRKRSLKIFLGVCGVIFLFALTALQAFPGLFAKFDDPARLGAPIHVTATNGFTIRWAEKVAAANPARLNLVFIHGTPGGAGVWAAQFETATFPDANLFAYDRPGFGGSKPVRAQPHLQQQVDALMTLLDLPDNQSGVARWPQLRFAHRAAGRFGAS